jgi:uncharacterized small protein (DUF1192 family)
MFISYSFVFNLKKEQIAKMESNEIERLNSDLAEKQKMQAEIEALRQRVRIQ